MYSFEQKREFESGRKAGIKFSHLDNKFTDPTISAYAAGYCWAWLGSNGYSNTDIHDYFYLKKVSKNV